MIRAFVCVLCAAFISVAAAQPGGADNAPGAGQPAGQNAPQPAGEPENKSTGAEHPEGEQPLPGGLYQRDEEPIRIIRGWNPREQGIWPEYLGLNTGLRQNITVADIIYPDDPWENFMGEKITPHSAEEVGATNFANAHNHYQNLLSSVWNFKEATNAVSIWGDSASLVNGAKSWGAFFSARSNATMFQTDKRMAPYWPKGLAPNNPDDFDCQLIGVEIDVLNGGKPGVNPNMSKTGLQIVGFGQPNSMGVEVRCQGAASKNPDDWQGQFANGMYFLNSLRPDGRLLVADFASGNIGFDMRRPIFKEGALSIRSEGVKTGLVLNDGRAGEVFGGLRWPDFQDKKQWITIRAGDGGIRMQSHDNKDEIFRADNHGGIYFHGTMYVNGKKIDFSQIEEGANPAASAKDRLKVWRDLLIAGLVIGVIVLGSMVVRLQGRLAQLTATVATLKPAAA